MTLKFIPGGNILDSQMQTLVCPVNTRGVMGKGLALVMAKRYRGLLYHYRIACQTGNLQLGHPWVYSIGKNQQVLCFATKDDWRDDSQMVWIEDSLQTLVKNYQDYNIESIAFPMLGCGLGQLDWEKEVRPVMMKHLKKLPIPVEIYGANEYSDQIEGC